MIMNNEAAKEHSNPFFRTQLFTIFSKQKIIEETDTHTYTHSLVKLDN
jgi:hypothetical protein